MTDRELLEQLFKFFQNREFILGDEKSVRDMVTRYQRPPLTLAYRVAMKMKVHEFSELSTLLEKIAIHLQPVNAVGIELPEGAVVLESADHEH